MSNLPTHVIHYILDYNNKLNCNLLFINKRCYKKFNRNRQKKAIFKIKRWYRYNTFQLPENYEWWKLNLKYNIKYYRKYYPKYLFLRYPEFMANKLRRNDLLEYIQNNMEPVENRSRYEVVKFLTHNNISKTDLEITGW